MPPARTKSRKPTTPAAKTASRRATSQPSPTDAANGKDARSRAVATNGVVPEEALEDLLEALIAAKKGDFSERLSIRRKGILAFARVSRSMISATGASS